MRPLRIVMLVAGIVVGLLALGLGAGGGVALWAHETQRDASGFYTTGPHQYATSTYALTSSEIDLGVHAARWLPRGLGTVRIELSPAQGSEVFAGIAPRSAAAAYLSGVTHSVVTDVRTNPFRYTSIEVAGDRPPAKPADQTFWVARAQSAGPTALTWNLRSGSWVLVVMNADASPGVEARLAFGVKTGILFPIGVGLLIAAGVLGAGAFLLIFFAARRPRPGVAGPLPPPRPDRSP
ncbi:MAG TPA: hypothetical protein VFC04_08765 [Actinomycetota bacterium]|nr:hypothetical protein [Actinomycetota bacterium]